MRTGSRPRRLNATRKTNRTARGAARIAARRRALRRVRAVAAASGHRITKASSDRNALDRPSRYERRVEPDDWQDEGVWIDYGGDCLAEGEDPDYWNRQAKLRKEKQRKARREELRRRVRGAICFLLSMARAALRLPPRK